MKIVLAGGSGFLGQVLQKNFGADPANEVVVLSRTPAPAEGRVRTVIWDGRQPGHWVYELEGADLLVNLTGKSVNCRYTEPNRREILRSRVEATQVLDRAVAGLAQPPKVWMNASSATWYRNAEDRPMDEYTGETAQDFSMGVVQAWEAAFFAQEIPGVRKVALRISLVLGKNGGVWPVFRQLATFGLAGSLGSGRQKTSWIHEQDVVAAVKFLYETEGLSGPVNVTAPEPVSNAEFMQAVRKNTGPGVAIHQPEWMVRMGAVLMGTEAELVLKSRWVVPARLKEWGFTFKYPRVSQAMEALT
jgi:hypothetical protein